MTERDPGVRATPGPGEARDALAMADDSSEHGKPPKCKKDRDHRNAD